MGTRRHRRRRGPGRPAGRARRGRDRPAPPLRQDRRGADRLDGVLEDGHVREGQDVVLAWGDRAGADPSTAPAELRFDAARAVAQLDALYALDVFDLGVVDDDGAIARHKIVVVVDGTWSGPGAPTGVVVVPSVGGLVAARARGHRIGDRRRRAAAGRRAGTDRAGARVRDGAGHRRAGGRRGLGVRPVVGAGPGVRRGGAGLRLPGRTRAGSRPTTPRRSGRPARPTWPPWPRPAGSVTPPTWCAARSCTGRARAWATAAGCCCSTSRSVTASSCWGPCGARRRRARTR